MQNHISIAGTLAVTAILAGMVLVATQGVVWPHDAIPTAAKPQGWKYPFSCCSGFDCREVTSGPQGTVHETDRGYVIAKTGEVLPYTGDNRVKNSPDGEFHWCSVAGLDDSRTICLFVPPRGM